MEHRAKPILALDPGLRGLGLAVMTSSGRLRHAEVLTAPLTLPLRERISMLAGQVDERIALFHPRVVVIEATWPSRNRAFDRVHHLVTLLSRRIRGRGIRVATIPAGTVRRAITGSGWTSKGDMARILATRFAPLRIYLRQDRAWKERHFLNLFDAVALAVHHQTKQ